MTYTTPSNVRALILALMLLGLSPTAHADPSGMAFATKVFNRADGDDFVALTTMTLRGGGRDRVRKLYFYGLDGAKPGDTKLLARFTEPGNIAGTGLLTIDYADKDDSDQWIFLPALGRERRISSQRKGGSFVGSDFTYEDLRNRQPAKDRHTITGTVSRDGKPLTMLQSVPVDPDNSIYSKRVANIDPDTLIAMQVDFYTEGTTTPVKRLEVQKIEKKDGYWTVMESTMANLLKKTSTHLENSSVSYDQGIKDKLFSPRNLRAVSRMEKKWRP